MKEDQLYNCSEVQTHFTILVNNTYFQLINLVKIFLNLKLVFDCNKVKPQNGKSKRWVFSKIIYQDASTFHLIAKVFLCCKPICYQSFQVADYQLGLAATSGNQPFGNQCRAAGQNEVVDDGEYCGQECGNDGGGDGDGAGDEDEGEGDRFSAVDRLTNRQWRLQIVKNTFYDALCFLFS